MEHDVHESQEKIQEQNNEEKEVTKLNESTLDANKNDVERCKGQQCRIVVTDIIGNFGLYQLSLNLLTFLRYVCVAMMTNTGPLIAPDVKFTCILPIDLPYNGTSEQLIGACKVNLSPPSLFANNSNSINSNWTGLKTTEDQIYHCQQWQFDVTTTGRTLTSEFGLVCDRDWLRSVFQSSVSVGVAFASLTWGTFSDRHGRARTIQICFIVSLVFGCLSIGAPNFVTYTLARCICTVGDLGLVVSLSTIIVESVGNKYRGPCCVAVYMGWATGVMIMPWLVDYFLDFRQLMIFTVACHVATLPWLLVTNESTRWLFINGHYTKAYHELKRICIWNSLMPCIYSAPVPISIVSIRESKNLNENDVNSNNVNQNVINCNITNNVNCDEIIHEDDEIVQSIEKETNCDNSNVKTFNLSCSNQIELSNSDSGPIILAAGNSRNSEYNCESNTPTETKNNGNNFIGDENEKQNVSIKENSKESFDWKYQVLVARFTGIRHNQQLQQQESNSGKRRGKLAQLVESSSLLLSTATIVWMSFIGEMLYMAFILVNSDVGKNLRLNYAIGGLMELLATFLSGALLSYTARRVSLTINFICIASVSCALALTYNIPVVSVWILSLAKLSISTLTSLNYVVSTEAYPTDLRQTGTGVCATLGSFGAVVAPFLCNELADATSMSVVFWLFGGLALSPIVPVVMFLRETKDVELPDSVDEI